MNKQRRLLPALRARRAGSRAVRSRSSRPVFACRAFCASLLSSLRSAHAAPSLRSSPRRRHPDHERACGARDTRRATRAPRGESAGSPLSFVAVRGPRAGCVSGLRSVALCVVSRASLPLFARRRAAAREARACDACATRALGPFMCLVACVCGGVELERENAWSWAKKTCGVEPKRVELGRNAWS